MDGWFRIGVISTIIIFGICIYFFGFDSKIYKMEREDDYIVFYTWITIPIINFILWNLVPRIVKWIIEGFKSKR